VQLLPQRFETPAGMLAQLHQALVGAVSFQFVLEDFHGRFNLTLIAQP